MTVGLEQVLSTARRLPRPEQAELARILMDDLGDSRDNEIEELWIAEAERRYTEYSEGRIDAIDGEEVMARIRSRFK